MIAILRRIIWGQLLSWRKQDRRAHLRSWMMNLEVEPDHLPTPAHSGSPPSPAESTALASSLSKRMTLHLVSTLNAAWWSCYTPRAWPSSYFLKWPFLPLFCLDKSPKISHSANHFPPIHQDTNNNSSKGDLKCVIWALNLPTHLHTIPLSSSNSYKRPCFYRRSTPVLMRILCCFSPQGYGFCNSFLLLCIAIFASLVEYQLLLLKIDCLDLPVVQGTLKSLLQHHSSKASIFSAFNLPYGPTLTSIHDYWKNHCIALIVCLWLYRSLLAK